MKKLLITLIALALTAGTVVNAKKEEPKWDNPTNVLIFSKTAGYRHASISSGMKMLYDLSKKEAWVITATEDAGLINDDFLSGIDVIVLLNCSGNAFNAEQESAFKNYIESGKGYVGAHAASDFMKGSEYYKSVLGATFKTHPPCQEGTLIIEDDSHPAMKPFKGMKTYTTIDEWYTFGMNPRDNKNIKVLASLDESSIKKENKKKETGYWKMGDHPVIWYQIKGDSRIFYTVFGHTHEAFEKPEVKEQFKQAINWAAKRID